MSNITGIKQGLPIQQTTPAETTPEVMSVRDTVIISSSPTKESIISPGDKHNLHQAYLQRQDRNEQETIPTLQRQLSEGGIDQGTGRFLSREDLQNSLFSSWQTGRFSQQQATSETVQSSRTNNNEETSDSSLASMKRLNVAEKVAANLVPGTVAYWVWQARHMCDFFAGVSIDKQHGGYFSHINSKGEVTSTEKYLMPTSRQVYSYATTFDMTGEKKYLDLARHGVEFMMKHHMRMNDDGEIYWIQHVKQDGTPVEGEEKRPLTINEQTYALTGLIACYKATKDPELLYTIKQTHKFITNHFHDNINGGFYDSVNPETLQPENRTKSYNSTVYPATSALLEMADMAEGRWKMELLKQIKELADIFVRHFPDPQTGFINENFTDDWQINWNGWQKQPEGTVGVVGHNTQGALFLLRAERLLGLYNTNYAGTAQKVLDSMLDRGYDQERGGWYDVYYRETGKNAWHTNKAHWQQEEGYLATLAMSTMRDDPKYRQATEKTLEFWDKHFIDRTVGGNHTTVTADGTPLDEPKGNASESSYHSVEMARLALDIMGY